MAIIDYLSEILTFLAGLGTTLGGTLAWNQRRKKQKQTSTQLLYEELENLKNLLIEKTLKEIQDADEKADIQIILHQIEVRCKSCFDEVMKKIEEDKNLKDGRP
jgi:hypothetical protein